MNRATLDSFDALFISAGQRLGHFTPRAAEDAAAAAARLARSGHPVPIEALVASLGLADEPSIEEVAKDVASTQFSCTSCHAILSGKDLMAKRSVKCPRCNEAGVERVRSSGSRAPSARIPGNRPPSRPPSVISKQAILSGKAFEEVRRVKIPIEPEAKPESGDPWLGKNFGRYRVKGLLGIGGWGNVYLADSEEREFAVKILRPELATSADHLDRFMTEARLTASLDHGVIRRTMDIGKHHGQYYMAMEYIDGASLHAIVTANGALPPTLAVQIASKLAEALHFAVRRGVVHRDIKPRNVLISRAGEVKLTDFGLAKMLLDGSSMTGTGAILGTPEFMSPEQFDGAHADLRSDIYSLGCTLFFMLTGRPPFEGPDFGTLMRRHKSGLPPSPLRFNPDVPATICSTLSRMLEKAPAKRFQDYEQFLEAISTDKGAATKAGRDEAEGLEEQWMDEERVKRCAELQAMFTAEGMPPPPRWHVLAGLGYASGEKENADDGFFAQPVTLKCAKCRKAYRFKLPMKGAFACPGCHLPDLAHAMFTMDSRACFLFLRIGEHGAASPEALDDFVRAAAIATQTGGWNVVLDFSACGTFPIEVMGPLLRLKELLTASRVAPTLLVSPKGVKQMKARGLQEFFLAFSSEQELEQHIDGARLCPHVRYFLCAVRGQLNEQAEQIGTNLLESTQPCIDREAFLEFYPKVREALRKSDARGARVACAELGRRLAKAPCLQAAAKRIRDLADDAIKTALEHAAQGHLARGRTDRARIAAKEALAAFPDSPAAADVLAQIALREGRPSEAAGHFEAAARGAPSPAEYRLSEAAALQRAGDSVAALKCLDDLLVEDPSQFRAALFKGTVHFGRGEYEDALGAFTTAMEIQPESAEILLWRGRTHHRLNKLNESLRDFVMANRLEPRRPRTLANCGAICARLKRHTEAIAFLRAAIKLNPALAGPRYNLACSLVATGDMPTALQALREAVAAGWYNRELTERDPLLKALRAHPDFKDQFDAILADMPTQGETEDY